MKKEQFKFTIQFSPGDPHHRQTAELLNSQGRRKAQFITNAVLHYINCTETPEIAEYASIGRDDIEALVVQIVKQHTKSISAEHSHDYSAHEPDTSQMPSHTESIRISEVSELLGPDGMDAIMSSLSAIKNKSNHF